MPCFLHSTIKFPCTYKHTTKQKGKQKQTLNFKGSGNNRIVQESDKMPLRLKRNQQITFRNKNNSWLIKIFQWEHNTQRCTHTHTYTQTGGRQVLATIALVVPVPDKWTIVSLTHEPPLVVLERSSFWMSSESEKMYSTSGFSLNEMKLIVKLKAIHLIHSSQNECLQSFRNLLQCCFAIYTNYNPLTNSMPLPLPEPPWRRLF